MHILHFEDSPNDGVLIEDLIREEWPDARITRVSQQATFQATLADGGIDLIISDYSVPGFSGMDALELAHRNYPEIPFVFMSGTIGEERAIETLRRGASDYLIKDRPARLVPVIRQALARAKETAERRRTERALRESEQRFRQLAEHSGEVFWFVSVESEQILHVSPAVERIWGWPAERFYREPGLWKAAIHPQDRPRVETAYRSWLEGKAPAYEAEYRVVRPDGTVSWILDSGTLIRDEQGRPYRASGIAKDITARHLAEEQMREQAALLDKARDAIIAIDLNQRIFYWNASAARMYGWPPGEVFGRDLAELGLGHDPERFKLAQARTRAEGEWRGEFSLRPKDGGVLHVESTWSQVRDAADESSSILMIDTDVTERKLMESHLLRAERMDSLGMLAGGVAHDLNNVLAPILMGADLLLTKKLDPRDLRLIENMERSAQHGANLVKQLLDYARGGAGKRGVVDVPALVEDAVRLLRQSCPPGIRLVADCPGAIRAVHADATQFKQVLLNLGLNARDAMPHGGSLTIRVGESSVDERIARQHHGAQPGPHVLVSVIDTGTGIPQAVLAKIFDPFFTTKEVGKGTGLGLSTVAGIVKNHGGIIEVKSELGRGTEFHVYLPVYLQPVSEARRSADPFGNAAHGELVLVIDDDPSILDTLRLVLEHCGFRVTTAASGPEAIAEYESAKEPIDVVITDIRMPGMSGVDLIAAIRAHRPGQAILAMSGALDQQQAAALREVRPAVELLEKPITSEVILAAVRRLLAAKGGGPRANDGESNPS